MNKRRPGSFTERWRFPAVLVALATIWLTMLLRGGGALDQRIYEALYAGRNPALVTVARFITFFGEPTVLIAAGIVFALVMWWRGQLRIGLTLVAVTMVGRGLSEIQKFGVDRLRPTLEPHLTFVSSPSFPSGHATSSMIFYLTLALVLTRGSRWRHLATAAAVLTSLLIGLSRVMLGVHWPSDVIAGWAFGLLWVLVTLRVAEHLLRTDPGRAPNAL